MKNLLTRRQFLGQASCAAVGSTALFSTLLNLRMASTAAAQGIPAGGDYKALVCLFFAGGCDSYNMLLPYGDSEYAEYAAIRADLALSKANNQILPLTLANPIGKELGVHHMMPEIQSLFNNGNAAWLANVGTLVEPTTKAQYQAESVILPLGLYSHSDQIRQWQTSVPQDTSAIGWGGRTADLLHSLNNNDNISMNISIAGNNTWQAGNEVFEYSISPNGSVGRRNYDATWGVNPAMNAAVDNQLDSDYQNLFQSTFAKASKSAIDSHLEFSAATDAVPDFATTFPEGNHLASQLRMVATSIAAHTTLNMNRQTFFVQLGGWDHHDEVLNNMDGMVPIVSQAIDSFYSALTEINEQNNVTLFTASDFGRTLTSNGAGSDHAWGGNHLVVGGAVNGGNVYGTYPDLYEGSPIDTGRGRLIPTTSVDQYFAELALWFGVSPQDLPTVLPNVTNFYTPGVTPPLGFMQMS
ncbi:DUF1501 domain-containing protein [Rubellicoccus peritrichatus]|uniref:DUF1501 domain-containing protein n=1 Tax=Rubellicoccus peritrichatus TaxID=3080537 RepID=A0AAQ3LAZ4_9BACT|nr:DUF1501 domain-containing protein [Puniceicoccus sp. CR14]WOO42809.1 DUF1501 domain-containing protein [Puniceicoccus sp. CR14]